MSRIIKFRAWDRENKKMIFSGVEFQLRILDTGNVENFKPNDDIGYSSSIIESVFDIMQFTGFHDKNGKEIYEGDILRLHTGTNIDKRLHKVVYFLGCFCLTMIEDNGETIICGKKPMCIIDKDLSNAGIFLDAKDVLDVIGDIYRNPELIDAK